MAFKVLFFYKSIYLGTMHVVRKDRSGTVGQSLDCIYLSFTLLAEPLSDDSVTPREAAVSRETHAERFDVIQHRTLSLRVATAQVSSPYFSMSNPRLWI